MLCCHASVERMLFDEMAMWCSGPGQVMELELKVDASSMKQLLQFLTGGFNGGTDVDKPLELSLKRLGEKEWNQVAPPPSCCIAVNAVATVSRLKLRQHQSSQD